MILYRPVGLQEMELIYDSGMKAFPARQPQQPIFYPVLDLAYARQTASGWNAKNGQLAGYVTEFKVEDEYIDKFEQHAVGGSQHQEYWIPAEQMDEFNRHITGHIKVVEAHFAEAFQGFIPDQFGLQGKNAVEQFTLLTNSYLYKRMDFYLEIKRNHKAVFLNYPFWHKHEFKNPALKEKVLQAIKEAWLTSFPKVPLPVPYVAEAGSLEDADPFVDEEDEEDTPDEPIILHSRVDPVEEQDRPEEEKKSTQPVKPVPEKIQPVSNKEARPPQNPVRKEIPPEKKIPPQAPATPPHRENRPPINTPFHGVAKPAPVQSPPRPVKQAESHFVQGVKLGLNEKYDEAVEELSRAVKEDPAHVVAQTSLGVAYRRLGQDDRALSCYDAALRKDPKYGEALYFRANILYGRGDVRQAIEGYTAAIGLQPELIDAHQKEPPQDRLTDYSSSPSEMYWLARAARRILDLNGSIKANPRQAQSYKERAAEYTRLRNYEQAIEDYGASLAIQPDDAGVHHLRGLAYEQTGQLDRALEDYQRAVTIHPQLSNVYIERGVTFGKMGNYRQSIASLNEAIRLAPKNPDAYFNRGTTFLQIGDFEDAIADFSMVIELSPKDEDAYYWRGISNEEAGRQREAIEDYRRFITISRNLEAREEIEQKLIEWDVFNRNPVREERASRKPGQPEKPDQNSDLHAILTALGERATHSTWLGSGVKCEGEKAKELYTYTDRDQPIEGEEFLRLTSGIRRTIEGDFQAFDPGAASPWLFIRAWNGNGFYIETNDPKTRKLLMSHFQEVQEVEGAAPPYESLFISSG